MAIKDMEMITGRFEIKSADREKREFEGDLSTSHLDLGDGFMRDIVWPGGFKRTLDHFAQSEDPYVPLLDSHDRFSILSVLGHMMEAEEVLTGDTLTYALEGGDQLRVPEMKLRTRWKVIEGDDGGRVLDRLRPGSVRNMSMGYRPINFEFATLESGERLRILKEVKLREGSLVVFGMNPEAQVDLSSVKGLLASLAEMQDPSPSELADLERLKARVDSLLTSGKDPDPPASEGPDPERVAAILSEIDRLKAEGLATRIDLTLRDAARLGSAPGTIH